ncbi:hypothetical protein FRAAL0818 [Frankia alni ACN14a]|uniref:Uncharacterized protein n=1 Tax=Frankia alni (strain DSM 45986 / CECT 9034 / ACN14a) TaxID=326424 RepID=Q0RSH5_FRAAA|nr:hypothetical protein FRAAL0818 [Frankia alni ACN14a]
MTDLPYIYESYPYLRQSFHLLAFETFLYF